MWTCVFYESLFSCLKKKIIVSITIIILKTTLQIENIKMDYIVACSRNYNKIKTNRYSQHLFDRQM